MKLLHLTLVAFVIMIVGDAHPEMTETTFIERHRVEASLQEILDDHCELLASLVDTIHKTPLQKHGVWQFDWLPGYYVKYNIARLFMRERLATCIEQENLTLLHTPEKYLYHIKGRPHDLHNLNYVIVVKALTENPHAHEQPMHLSQVKQFITLIEKTGHCSTFAHNYLRLHDGRISFIDTDGTFNRKNPIRGIIDLLNRDLSSYYSQDALYHIIDCLAAHLTKLPKQEREKAEKRIATMLESQEASLVHKIYTLLREREIAHIKSQKLTQKNADTIKVHS